MNTDRNFALHTMPRVYVEQPFGADETVQLDAEQSHYLMHVMRLKNGDKLRFFNGKDGEWVGNFSILNKKTCAITPQEQVRIQTTSPELALYCAPIKKAYFEYMIEKATELGITRLCPLLTQRTQIREINHDRCRAIAIESAEQSERLSIPAILPPIRLDDFAESAGKEILAIVCAEWGAASPVAQAFSHVSLAPTQFPAIITGPEGGFTEEELDILRKIPHNIFVRLGPRILRADTAALAALSCWQAIRGDWNIKEQ